MFCPQCGTALTFRSGPDADEVDVTVCSFDHPEMVKSWQWDFGDGTKSPIRTGTLLPEPKVYADSKHYTVVLTAYDAQGQPLGVATHPGVVRRRSVRH